MNFAEFRSIGLGASKGTMATGTSKSCASIPSLLPFLLFEIRGKAILFQLVQTAFLHQFLEEILQCTYLMKLASMITYIRGVSRPQAKTRLPPVQVNMILLQYSHTHSLTYCLCLFATIAELSGCDKHRMGCKH